MLDRLKAIVTSLLAFGALAIPGFTAFVTELGGDAGVMQAVVGGYAVYHVIRLAVDYLHSAAFVAHAGVVDSGWCIGSGRDTAWRFWACAP